MADYTSEHTGVEIDLAVESANLMLLTGAADPATSTVGTLGQIYQNTTDGTLFRCTNIAGETYTWTEWADYSLAEKAKVTAAIPTASIVNDLTTGGATVPLSAEQGKELKADIGNQTYTEDNYITDSEPLTESVDKLDMAVKDNADLISTKVSMLPIATYTHTTNKEVVVSAVDVDTDTFTSVAHGLLNGQKLYPIINVDAGMIYPINVYPTGLIMGTYDGYFVINKTDNTFQLSLTSGGAAINITANANLDLTKWHFEVGISAVNITGIPNLTKCKLIIRGRSLASGQFQYCLPNTTSIAQEWCNEANSAYNYQQLNPMAGDVSIYAEVIIDYTDILTVVLTGFSVKSNNATSNIGAAYRKTACSPKYRDGSITSIYLYNSWIANGTVVEVYEI